MRSTPLGYRGAEQLGAKLAGDCSGEGREGDEARRHLLVIAEQPAYLENLLQDLPSAGAGGGDQHAIAA